jgi:endonuclease/exonuclease/phosphatase family metal-dependent hydrolase
MKKPIKIIAIVVAALVLAIVLLFGAYFGYVAFSYYRIDDNLSLTVEGTAESKVKTGEEYSLMSYNVGFGAYSPNYTFFLDEGEMNDGTPTVGVHGKGISAEDVKDNVDGQESVIKAQSTDFVFLQEVDEEADRSYHINMLAQFKAAMPTYSSVYASNFHTAYLMYPFNDPIGATKEAGILTLSKYKIQSSVRRSLPLSDSFISNLFDLDRCFSVSYLPIDGSDKNLTLINIHMSAYDEGGTVRAKQLQMLNNFLTAEKEAGNYVIVGGDFNHCLIADQFSTTEEALSYFPSDQKTPEWVKNSVLRNDDLASGFKIVASTNASTCRGADMVYKEGVTYSTVIDGFIVSDNIEVKEEGTIQTNFAYSDHNPVKITFSLKA